MSQHFLKTERLKSKTAFDALFTNGKSVKYFPVRMVFLPNVPAHNTGVQVGFSVSKRRFKNAPDRNRIKRQLREAYRLNKHQFLTKLKQPYAVVFIYLHHQQLPYATIEKCVVACLEKLADADAK